MKRDYKEVFEKMVQGTLKYLKDNNIWAMILGVSGGLDSTVTAAICHEVEKRDPKRKFYGYGLPCSSNTSEENDSASICMKAFCKSGQWQVENLQYEYELMCSTCGKYHTVTTIGQGNIKARLRMIYLYDMANYTSGLVMDTDNLTEHYLGFFTIHGDVADLNPIGGLWKHEIYELAKYLLEEYYNSENCNDDNCIPIQLALKADIGITPTDGNGVNDLGDMGQIAPAFAHDNNYEAYKKVDDIIQTYLEYRGHHPEEYQIAIEELYKKYPNIKDNGVVIHDTVNDVISRIRRTEYKRNKLPVVVKID